LLFNLIPIEMNGREARAYHSLVNQAPYDVITDVKVIESWRWPVIGITYRTTLTATAYPRIDTRP
jgi:hypothetical protein